MADSFIDLVGKALEPLAEPAKATPVPPAKESGSYLGLKFRDRTRDERKRMLMAEMDEHYLNYSDQEYIEIMERCRDRGIDLDPRMASSFCSLSRAGLATLTSDMVMLTTDKFGRKKLLRLSKPYHNYKLESRFYMLTDLGSDFCSVCLPDPLKKEEQHA